MNNSEKKSNVRVRFAPSPTGYLHIGNLRAAIFNWLFARNNGGMFLIRIEDTDRERSKQEYKDYLMESLDWIGIDYDEAVVIQSSRIEEHKKLIKKLIDEKKAYRCYCSQEDIKDRNRSKAGYEDLFMGYDGFCRDRVDSEDLDKPFVVRFKLPDNKKSIHFKDLIRGSISFEIEQFDDFIIARSDGTPMYNLVVVVDDDFMKISHIIRGEDHISNTPKQILLYEALGYKVPDFAHIPLILGPSGDKLSKRDAAVSVLEYKKQGILPEALLNYLVRLGWSHGDQEIFTKNELVSYFSLDHVGKKGAIFDVDKLLWLNSVYIREMSAKSLKKRIEDDLQFDYKNCLGRFSESLILRLIDLYKGRSKTLQELKDHLVLIHDGPKNYDMSAIGRWIDEKTLVYLEDLIDVLKVEDNFAHDILASIIKKICKEHSVKLVALAQPIRIALTGSTASPGIFDLLEIVSKDQSIKRLEGLLEYAKGIKFG